MEKIYILSDSPSDLLPGDTAGAPYKIVSSSVIYDDGRVVLETEVDRAGYYEYLKTCKNIPSSAMGTPEQWIGAFREVADGGYTHVIVCTISSTASSVAQSITLARQALETEAAGALTVEVIDTRQYSMLYGRLILTALEEIRRGLPFAEIVGNLREGARRSQGVLGVYSLRCMQKSGRVSGMAAFAGGVLGIRPILLAQDGAIAPIDRVRGDKSVVPAIIRHVKERIVSPEGQTLYILHGSVPEEELNLLERLAWKEFSPKDVVRHSIGVTVITNSGPETVALGYFGA